MHHDIQLFAEYAVTPFVGVWIETHTNFVKQKASEVTPFVGVWIETIYRTRKRLQTAVTPFVGVWIETLFDLFTFSTIKGHTLRGCVD